MEQQEKNEIRLELPEKVRQIIEQIQKHGFEAYAVGGCVRDSLLGRTPDDWDITTSAKPQVTDSCGITNASIPKTGSCGFSAACAPGAAIAGITRHAAAADRTSPLNVLCIVLLLFSISARPAAGLDWSHYEEGL